MPILASLGAGSIGSYRIFSGASWPTDGTFGIFALGRTGTGGGNCGVTTRDKYTFSTDTSTSSGIGAASAASRTGSAAGNATRGIFALGLASGFGYSSVRNKYTYASDASTATGVASASQGGSQLSSAGNSTRGIFELGFFPGCYTSGTRNRNKYTYACDTSVAATSSGACHYGGSAAGNSTAGIFHIGLSGGNRSSTREKYTYASDSSTSAGVATATRSSFGSSATGNSTRGIFALGCDNSGATGVTATRNKYTYSTDTNTACGVAGSSINQMWGSAAGNSTRGIFAIGSITGFGNSRTDARNKYTYACCSSTAVGVGVASENSEQGAAASWAMCVNSP